MQLAVNKSYGVLNLFEDLKRLYLLYYYYFIIFFYYFCFVIILFPSFFYIQVNFENLIDTEQLELLATQ